MTEQGQDEILELLWTLREARKASRSEVLRSATEPAPERLLEELVEGGMVDASGEEILFTKSGEDRARGIIRRHRLAEVLLQNLFDLDNALLENSACQFEHILSEPVVESVCTFLGHPRLPARPPDPERGVLRPDPDGDPPPRHAPDRVVPRGHGADRLHHPAFEEAPGEALRPRDRSGKPGSPPAAEPFLRTRDRPDDGRRRPGHHG